MYRKQVRSQRITATLPEVVIKSLENRALVEGRSISNLIAYLLERQLGERPDRD